MTTTSATEAAKYLRANSKATAQILTEDEVFVTVPHFLSTGHVGLDSMLGGGVPSGRITEIYSKSEGQWKSTLAIELLKSCINTGGLAVLIDSEQAHTQQRLEDLGVDTEGLVYVDPEYAEKVFQLIGDTLDYADKHRAGEQILIVWDSVAGTPTKDEIDKGPEGKHMASLARVLSQNLKVLVQRLSKSNAYLVIINQTRMKMDGFTSGGVDTVGGKALKFYASVRVQLNKKFKGGNIYDSDKEMLGNVIEAQAVKNKISKPFKKVDLTFLYESGLSLEKGLFDFLLEKGVITQSGAWYGVEGVEKKFRQGDFMTTLETEVSDELKANIREMLLSCRVHEHTIAGLGL